MSFVLSDSELEWPKFEWNAVKARRNPSVHGVGFPAPSGVFLDPLRLQDADTREEYGEERYVTIGFVSQVLLAVVFTLRGDRITARGGSPVLKGHDFTGC